MEEHTRRKPLIVRGARQVGKSSLVRKLAVDAELRLAEINLEKFAHLDRVFGTKDLSLVLRELSGVAGFPIFPGSGTLLFLDEIQASPNALPCLRYFYEEMPDLPVVAAGSLLEFVLENHEFSMPVGRVTYHHVQPLTFREFLENTEESFLLSSLEELARNSARGLAVATHDKLMSCLGSYATCGGMPECLARLAGGSRPDVVVAPQYEILNTYQDDFSKYATRAQTLRLHDVFRAVPGIVGKKVKYADISRESRAKDTRAALHLLTLAGVVHAIHHSDCRGIPLESGVDTEVYKILSIDVGVLNAHIFGQRRDHLLTGVLFARWENGNPFEKSWLGMIAEQVLGQSLLAQCDRISRPRLHYWLREGKKNNAEIDFVITKGMEMIPIEVKAGTSGTLKSLHVFMAERGLTRAIRFDANPPSRQIVDTEIRKGDAGTVPVHYELISLPLYMADWLPEVIDNW